MGCSGCFESCVQEGSIAIDSGHVHWEGEGVRYGNETCKHRGYCSGCHEDLWYGMCMAWVLQWWWEGG